MSYPAENTGPSPVTTRQRESCSWTVWVIASRISWSSAPRLSGFEIVSRTTPAPGSSTRSFPPASSCTALIEDNQRVAFRYGLALLADDLGDGAVVLGLDRHLHLHRLEDHERVALLDLVADLALDLPDGSGDVGLHVGQLRSSSGGAVVRIRARYPPVTPEIAVVVSAYNEEDRLGDTLAALRDAFPGARLVVADDHSSDGTPDVARAAGAEVVRAPRHLGKGGTNTLAVRQALGPATATLVLCDADLGATARELPRLVEALERDEGDLAVASFARRAGGGFGIALGFSRWAIKRRTGLEPAAPISGQRALRRAVAEAV